MKERKITYEQIEAAKQRVAKKWERIAWLELTCRNKAIVARCKSQNEIFCWTIENIMKFMELSDFLNQKNLELYEKLVFASEQRVIKKPVGRLLLSDDIKFKLPKMTEKIFCDCVKRSNSALMQAPNSYLHNYEIMLFQKSEQLKTENGVNLFAIPNKVFPADIDKKLGAVNRTLACLCVMQVFSLSEILSFDHDIFECSVLSRNR